MSAPTFSVIPGAQVRQVLGGREREIVDLVEAAYRLHAEGHTVNPPSYFLRFPDRPSSRIIALPASLGGAAPVDGLKWIASSPANVASGLPRASAVLILNDPATGFPFACLEASVISATRTAAMAVSAADWLSRGGARPRRLGIVGTGLIARYVHTFLAATGWTFDEIGLHDTSPESASGFGDYLDRSGATGRVSDPRHRRRPGRARATWWSSRRWRPARTWTTRGPSPTGRSSCTCRCATWRRRSSSVRPTSSTTWSTVSRPTPPRI